MDTRPTLPESEPDASIMLSRAVSGGSRAGGGRALAGRAALGLPAATADHAQESDKLSKETEIAKGV